MRAHPHTGGADSSFVSVHVSLRQKSWGSCCVRRSRSSLLGCWLVSVCAQVMARPMTSVSVPTSPYPI